MVPSLFSFGNTSLTLMPGLGLVARVGDYNGIIDGLTPASVAGFGPPVWDLMVNRWILTHWCTGCICGWPGACVVVYLLCLPNLQQRLYLPTCGCITDGVGQRFAIRLAVALLMLSVGPVQSSNSTAKHYIADVDACLRFGCPCWSLRWYNWWSDPAAVIGLDRLSGLLRWSTMDFWVTGVVAVSVVGPGTCDGGNLLLVYQIYASIYICLCGGVTDGVGPCFGNVSWPLLLMLSVGPCQCSVAPPPAIHRWRWCLFGFGCPCWSLRWYNLMVWPRCCDWVWTACLVFCDGQRYGLGHWCGGRVCGWTRYLRGGNTCCVYQIYASIYICLCGCVTDGVGPTFPETSSWPLLLMLSVGTVKVPAPPPGNTSLTLMPVGVWLPVLVTTMV